MALRRGSLHFGLQLWGLCLHLLEVERQRESGVCWLGTLIVGVDCRRMLELPGLHLGRMMRWVSSFIILSKSDSVKTGRNVLSFRMTCQNPVRLHDGYTQLQRPLILNPSTSTSLPSSTRTSRCGTYEMCCINLDFVAPFRSHLLKCSYRVLQ